MARCSRGALPPVDLRAVCLVRAIVSKTHQVTVSVNPDTAVFFTNKQQEPPSHTGYGEHQLALTSNQTDPGKYI